MNFYKQYPMMRPYVGRMFRTAGAPSILLIGESHYIEEDSEQRSDSEKWYAGSSATLTEYEIGFISTTSIMEESRVDGFSNRSHSIWSKPFLEINEHGPGYSDFTLVADHIAFYNFFLRPAVDGGSLEQELSSRDIEIANEAFCTHCAELQPTAVVFLSSLAHNHLHPSESPTVPLIATPHPGCEWWNRAARKYGNRRGRDILADFIKTTKWPRSADF